MSNEKIIKFIETVVSVLQTDYDSTDKCREKMENLLNDADTIYKELTGTRIVKRGQSVLEYLVHPNDKSIRPNKNKQQ